MLLYASITDHITDQGSQYFAEKSCPCKAVCYNSRRVDELASQASDNSDRMVGSGVRVAEGARLESVYVERHRGFESLPDRHLFLMINQ